MAAESSLLILDATITDTRSSTSPARRTWSKGTLVRYLRDESGNEWYDLLVDHHQSSYRKRGERGDAIFAKVHAVARPIVPDDEQTAKVRIQRLAFRLSECGQHPAGAALLFALVRSGALAEPVLDAALRALEDSSDDEASVFSTIMRADIMAADRK